MKCFYHKDNDGRCAAGLVHHHYNNMVPRDTDEEYPEITMHPIDYGESFPWGEITQGEMVFMVDFCLQPFSDMERLNDMCHLFWIDHHVSALEEADKSDNIFQGLRRVGNAGCELVWEFLFCKEDMPEFVRLAGRYDVWDKTDKRMWEASILPFHYGISSLPVEMQTPGASGNIWEGMMNERGVNITNEMVNGLIKTGRVIMEYQKVQDAYAVKPGYFSIVVDGIRFCAVNAANFNSRLFASVYDPEKHDAMLGFCWKGSIGKWTCSIYCDDKVPDPGLLEFAKSMGGGGHPGAMGWQCDELPFKLGARR